MVPLSGPLRRLTVHIFTAALALYIATTGGSLTSTDATVTFDLTRSLVEDRSIALSGNLLGLEENRGADGRYYSQYGIGQAIFNVPFYAGMRAAQRVTGLSVGKPDSLLKAATSLTSDIAIAATVATVFAAAVLITGEAIPAFVAAFAAGVGSLLWPSASFGFNAPLTAWLLTTIVTLLWVGLRDDRQSALIAAGILSGMAWLTRHEFPVIIAALTVIIAAARWPSWPAISRALIAYLPGAALGGAVWMLYNAVRFGHPLRVGYHPAWGVEGYWGLLLSPAESILLYSPSVMIGIVSVFTLARSRSHTRSADRLTAWLLAGPAIASYLFFGALEDWAGGRAYGPRYLVPILPLLAIAVAPAYQRASRRGRQLIAVTIAISSLVQVPGVLMDYSRVSQTWARAADERVLSERLERWSASPLLLNAQASMTAVPRNTAYLSGAETPPTFDRTASEERHDFAQQFAFSLDFWWLYLVYLGVLTAPAALALALMLLGASLWHTRRAWQLAVQFDRRRVAQS